MFSLTSVLHVTSYCVTQILTSLLLQLKYDWLTLQTTPMMLLDVSRSSMAENGAPFAAVVGIWRMLMLSVDSWVMPMPSGPSRMLLIILFNTHLTTSNSGMHRICPAGPKELVQFGWTMLGVMEQKSISMIVTFPALQ